MGLGRGECFVSDPSSSIVLTGDGRGERGHSLLGLLGTALECVRHWIIVSTQFINLRALPHRHPTTVGGSSDEMGRDRYGQKKEDDRGHSPYGHPPTPKGDRHPKQHTARPQGDRF